MASWSTSAPRALFFERMHDASEDLETQRLAGAFRPNRKPVIVAILANGAMALLLLGVPYLRGHRMAQGERRAFAQFASCMFGGAIAPAPGLSLPRGEREHYAEKVMYEDPGWPDVCRRPLRALAPDDAIFLWPSVKTAGADLRAAVGLVERELARLQTRRAHGHARVPERPLRAIARLQAAVVLYARAGGVLADIDNDAIRFQRPTQRLASPARLPLTAGAGAALALYSDGLTLEALALDGRGLSYLRVADGKIDRERLRRTSFVRGVVRAGATPYVVWAMPEDRCDKQDDHCAGRSTGLAAYDKGGTALPQPSWKLLAHPAGRLDRVLHVSQTGRVDLLARANPNGGLELLRFRLPQQAPDAPEAKEPQSVEAQARSVLRAQGAPASALLLPGDPSAAVYAAPSGDAQIEAGFVWGVPDAQPLQLPAASGQHAWILGCDAGDRRYIAYGSSSELRVASVAPAANTIDALATRTIALPHALDEDAPSSDRVRLLCARGRAQLLFAAADHSLQRIACSAAGCEPAHTLAREVTGFSAVVDGEETLIAYAGVLQAAAVRVLRLDRSGAPRGEPTMPGACWEPLGGMCGTPVLVRDADRIVVAARDGADLLALESTDHGRTFVTLSGFVVGTSFEQSTTSPLKQHRLRKGLD